MPVFNIEAYSNVLGTFKTTKDLTIMNGNFTDEPFIGISVDPLFTGQQMSMKGILFMLKSLMNQLWRFQARARVADRFGVGTVLNINEEPTGYRLTIKLYALHEGQHHLLWYELVGAARRALLVAMRLNRWESAVMRLSTSRLSGFAKISWCYPRPTTQSCPGIAADEPNETNQDQGDSSASEAVDTVVIA